MNIYETIKDPILPGGKVTIVRISKILGIVFVVLIVETLSQYIGIDKVTTAHGLQDDSLMLVSGYELLSISLGPSNSTSHSEGELSDTASKLALILERQTPVSNTSQISSSITEDQLKLTDLNSSSFLLFKNHSQGVQIRYPMNWEIIEGDRNKYDGAIGLVRFISPLENGSDNYRERVRLSLDRLPSENMTLSEYSGGLIDFKNKTLDDFTLIDRSDDSNILADNTAYRLIYNYTNDDDINIKEMEIGTKFDDNVYYLVYSAEGKKYFDLFPTIKNIIDSLEIH